VSTLKSNVTAKRIALLASRDEKVFHIKDLANAWSIQNPNTLRVILKRYTENGLLYRIYRGFYALLPLHELDPLLLGAKALHRFCYVSTETVLFEKGYISHAVPSYTFVSDISKTFHIENHDFKSRQLKIEYLYNPEGIELENGVQKATVHRALADLLYFNPYYHLDKTIDFQKIKRIQKILGYPLTPNRYEASKTN
jgi:predicted transcriptional regulator of viral defense system